jgi:hypothetical protein
VPNQCPNVLKPAGGAKRRETVTRLGFRIAKPLPATFPDLPPPPYEPRGGSSPLIRLARSGGFVARSWPKPSIVPTRVIAGLALIVA